MEMIRLVRLCGGMIVFLLVLLNGLFATLLIGSSGMQSSTIEMLNMTRAMNASTTEAMVSARALMVNVTAEHVSTVVGNAVTISSDARDLVGAVAHSSINGTQLLRAINATKIAAALSDLFEMVHTVAREIEAQNFTVVRAIVADMYDTVHAAAHALEAENVTAIVHRVAEIADLLDPVVVRNILSDIQNVTTETRTIVDSLSNSHNLQVKF